MENQADKAYRKFIQEKEKARAKSADNLGRIAEDEHFELSYQLDKTEIQESCNARNVIKARRLANLLITEAGEIDEPAVKRAIEQLTNHTHFLLPNYQHDSPRNQHIIEALKKLLSDKSLKLALHKISAPHMNKRADDLIRATLKLTVHDKITDSEARRAALSAWLCYLRQSVGSCFATAPAIVIQREQPHQLLADLQELLTTGRLKRTFSGKEYAVPLSPSFGAGDLRRLFMVPLEGIEKQPGLLAALGSEEAILSGLPEGNDLKYTTSERIIRKAILKKYELTESELEEYESRPKQMMQSRLLVAGGGRSEGGLGRKAKLFMEEFEAAKRTFVTLADNPLLKAWEFTIASFAESKLQFAKWNLYSSLGFQTDEPGGIGEQLYAILKGKLDQSNAEAQKYQEEYEVLYQQVNFLQRRARGASSEKEAQWRRIEYQSKVNEFRTLEEMRNKAHYKARRYANLFNDLVTLYDNLFPNYFQEIYDADMHEAKIQFYDDSPAGFRLLYKHGRAQTSLWTLIHGPQEFIEALTNFFVATESEVTGSHEMEGLEDDVSEIVTAIVNHIRTPEFLESAIHRIAKVHNQPLLKEPLKHLNKIPAKPWAYPSGGSMDTLVSIYWRRDMKPTSTSRWVESPVELLTAFVDAIREMPDPLKDRFLDNPDTSLLTHSPTHAYLLKPGWFKAAWKARQYTYTWIRDQFILPAERFLSQIFLDQEKMQYVIEQLKKKIADPYIPFFQHAFSSVRGSMNLQLFRDYLVETIETTKGLTVHGRPVLTEEVIDSVLFSLIPLFPSYQLEERVETIVKQIDSALWEKGKKFVEKFSRAGVIGSAELKQITCAVIAFAKGETSAAVDYPMEVSKIAEKEGFSIPVPVIFADTNWPKDYFAFIVNPGTCKLSFWRIDQTNSFGAPMEVWDEYLNGQKKEPKWGLYTEPHEWVYEPPPSRF